MDEASVPFTAFTAVQGYCEWIVIPLALKDAPQIFQRRMENIFKNFSHCCLVYFDDTKICIDHGINPWKKEVHLS